MNRDPTIFLSGRRVALRPLREEDCTGPYLSWLNDAEVCAGNSHHVFPFTPAEAGEYLARARAARDELILAITLKKDGRHIGNIALQRINPVCLSAELAIIIGEKASWGKGYAGEACELLCSHGFSALNLHRIGCGTYENNLPMQRLARSLGMQEEGRRREAAWKDGRYLDILEFGMTREEHEKARKKSR
ncbi:MAG: GNAT family N-acetyltransferase [Methanomicrobiales archaeon]|nr:GNAT family N-acetyltransferase [Methanomicrobiales archaeon]